MRVNFTDKAKKYIRENNIDNIVIDLDIDSKNACCGLGSVDFLLIPKGKDKVKNYKMAENDFIEVFYSPAIEFYFKEDESMEIALLGFFKYKKLYVSNEINILKD